MLKPGFGPFHACGISYLRVLAGVLSMMIAASCNGGDGEGRGATYVKPSVDRRGRFRKGHVRMPVSTKKDAIKSQNRSRYYYKTRGKYNRKRKNSD